MSLEIIEKIRESDSLELALENALNKLKRAVKKRNDDLHLLNFVTVDDRNRPNTRNVVLRDFSIEDLTVRFHTDKRSSKIQDIKVNRDVCLIGYDKRAKLQIRIDAEANVVDDEEILMNIWHLTRKRPPLPNYSRIYFHSKKFVVHYIFIMISII